MGLWEEKREREKRRREEKKREGEGPQGLRNNNVPQKESRVNVSALLSRKDEELFLFFSKLNSVIGSRLPTFLCFGLWCYFGFTEFVWAFGL